AHQVIVAFDCGTSLTAIEVHAALIGAGQSSINRARERKYVHVIAVGGLAVQIVRGNRGRQWIQGQIERRGRHRICLRGKRSLGGCQQINGAARCVVNRRFNRCLGESTLAAFLAVGVDGGGCKCEHPDEGDRTDESTCL